MLLYGLDVTCKAEATLQAYISRTCESHSVSSNTNSSFILAHVNGNADTLKVHGCIPLPGLDQHNTLYFLCWCPGTIAK